MAVIRINKTADYTVISNTHFREKEMSLKGKGLLSLMLSLPDNWDYSIAGLVTLSKDGKDSVMNALAELEEFGYLRRTQTTDERGRFDGYDYDIYEKPITDKPQQEKPYAENPNTENPPQLNTNKSIIKEPITKKSNNIMADFESLWELYPRKLGKKKALDAYARAIKKGVSYETIKKGIENYNKQINANKTEPAFIKHGSTWFNGECWNDEYTSGSKTDQPDATQQANDGFNEWLKGFMEGGAKDV